MHRLAVIVFFMSIHSTVFATDLDFVGQYSQKIRTIVPAMSSEDCDTKVDWDSTMRACITSGENSLEIKSLQSSVDPQDSNLYHVKGTNHGLAGNYCEFDFKMKMTGDKMVLAQNMNGASKNYSLAIKRTKTGIQIIEKLGPNEQEANASPGCAVSAFINGNGTGFTKQRVNSSGSKIGLIN